MTENILSFIGSRWKLNLQYLRFTEHCVIFRQFLARRLWSRMAKYCLAASRRQRGYHIVTVFLKSSQMETLVTWMYKMLIYSISVKLMYTYFDTKKRHCTRTRDNTPYHSLSSITIISKISNTYFSGKQSYLFLYSKLLFIYRTKYSSISYMRGWNCETKKNYGIC